MYVIDRAAAAHEIARVLRPGGRLVAAVWGGPDQADIALFHKTAGSFAPHQPVPGVGTGLIDEAGRRALVLGCHSAHLDAFSFPAPDFYKKLGYRVFGAIDYPPDHRRFFLQKRLVEDRHADVLTKVG